MSFPHPYRCRESTGNRDTMRRKATLLLVLLLLLGLYLHQETAGTATVSTPEGDIRVAVADTPEERREGLMNRSEVPHDGMLFEFEQASELVFWMKDTRIPLDIVFLAEDGTVLNVEQADPEPGVPPEELARYRSDGPALYALELQQGRAEELGISAGTALDIRM